MKNNSKIYFNGSKWKTNNYGEVEIIGKSERQGYYVCKFENNTIVEACSSNIKIGNIKNPNFPSVYKVGFVGIGKNLASINKKLTYEYILWSSMLCRCYNKKFQFENPSYIGCVVDESWHNFQNFCEDIKYLEGYNEWKNNNNYELDKDIKIKGNKIYSKDFCKFVTKSENIINASITGLTYIGTRLLDNYQEEFINQNEFARKYDLHLSNVSKCIFNKQIQTKGWVIKIKTQGGV